MDKTITLYEWILQTFTIASRESGLKILEPYLVEIMKPGDFVLDLCCGTGRMSFWFEDQGANVTAVDFAPYMIALAREEAERRRMKVEFVEADIFNFDMAPSSYDLISCFGNSISDFSLVDYQAMVERISASLKPGGRFALQYHDGSYTYIQGLAEREGVYQETPERVTFRFERYLPEDGAYILLIENELRGQQYFRKGFIYSIPVIKLITGMMLKLERHIVLEENHFLDLYIKQ
jgi:SAM-dependent methyltransferase